MKAPRFIQMLEELSTAQVDYIVVGGVAAVAQGAPVSTFDVDIVHDRTAANVDRLFAALLAMDAYYRGRGTQRLTPERHHLEGPGHNLLLTRFGPLDVLGSIIGGLDYTALLPDAVVSAVGKVDVRFLGLGKLIEVKEALGRDKDKAVLAILKQTLAQRSK